jgi:hypothetical protein
MSATTITIRVTDRVEPVRKRINIPADDIGTLNWFDAQRDPSTSLRLLILEEARVHGYVDRVIRTGTQLRTAAPAAAPAPPAGVPTATPAGPLTAVFTTATQNLPTVPTGPTAVPNPAPVSVPVTDPRDNEIALLKDQLTKLRQAVSPFMVYDIDDDLAAANAA